MIPGWITSSTKTACCAGGRRQDGAERESIFSADEFAFYVSQASVRVGGSIPSRSGRSSELHFVSGRAENKPTLSAALIMLMNEHKRFRT
jgi:hypothetical protein